MIELLALFSFAPVCRPITEMSVDSFERSFTFYIKSNYFFIFFESIRTYLIGDGNMFCIQKYSFYRLIRNHCSLLYFLAWGTKDFFVHSQKFFIVDLSCRLQYVWTHQFHTINEIWKNNELIGMRVFFKSFCKKQWKCQVIPSIKPWIRMKIFQRFQFFQIPHHILMCINFLFCQSVQLTADVRGRLVFLSWLLSECRVWVVHEEYSDCSSHDKKCENRPHTCSYFLVVSEHIGKKEKSHLFLFYSLNTLL